MHPLSVLGIAERCTARTRFLQGNDCANLVPLGINVRIPLLHFRKPGGERSAVCANHLLRGCDDDSPDQAPSQIRIVTEFYVESRYSTLQGVDCTLPEPAGLGHIRKWHIQWRIWRIRGPQPLAGIYRH